MERGSVQHGARLDEALAEGSELLLRGGAMAEREDRQPELPAEDEPAERRTHDAAVASGPDPAEVRERSELARWLPLSRFPADAATLIAGARGEGAPADVIAELEVLPADVHYETVGEVWRALGGPVEVRDADAEVAPDADLGEAVTRAVTEVVAEVAGGGAAEESPEIEPLVEEAVVEGGVLVDEPLDGVIVRDEVVLIDGMVVEDAVVVAEPTSGSAAAGAIGWSERHEEYASLPAQAVGLAVAVIDLALVPVRVGVSLIGRVLGSGAERDGDPTRT